MITTTECRDQNHYLKHHSMDPPLEEVNTTEEEEQSVSKATR